MIGVGSYLENYMAQSKLIVATFATLVTICGLASGAMAQTTSTPLSQQSLQEFQQNNQSSNPLGGGNGLNILQLIHNANLLNGKSSAELSTSQQESFDAATQEFRLQQRQKLNVNNPALLTPK